VFSPSPIFTQNLTQSRVLVPRYVLLAGPVQRSPWNRVLVCACSSARLLQCPVRLLGCTAGMLREKWAQEGVVVWLYAAVLSSQFSDGGVSWKLEGPVTVSSCSVFTVRFANNFLKFFGSLPTPPNPQLLCCTKKFLIALFYLGTSLI